MSRMLALFTIVWAGMTPLTAFSQQPTQQNPTVPNPPVQQLTPALEQILQQWSQSSSQIKTLEGQHQRYVYDTVFNVESRADGYFYYEAPDKGRIDLKAAEIKEGEVSRRVDEKTKQPFSLKADKPERWICDGEKLIQIDDQEMTVEIFEIPEHGRGRNIMEGPLPFLFGMPPELAKRRYFLQLLKDTPTQIWLSAKPRWPQDAANYSQASIILDRATFLPVAVQLKDPSGNRETVFTFKELQVNVPNRGSIFTIFKGDPFKPNLKEHKLVVRQVENTQAAQPPSQPVVPSVLNFPWKDAKAHLEQAGYVVKLQPGKPIANAQLHYVVYEQIPAPRTPLQPGQVVVLTVYDDPNRQK